MAYVKRSVVRSSAYWSITDRIRLTDGSTSSACAAKQTTSVNAAASVGSVLHMVIPAIVKRPAPLPSL